MKSLADSLLSVPKEIRTKSGKSSVTLASYERNSGKPCTSCGNPERNKAKSGRCYTTLCTSCYKAEGYAIRERLRRAGL